MEGSLAITERRERILTLLRSEDLKANSRSSPGMAREVSKVHRRKEDISTRNSVC